MEELNLRDDPKAQAYLYGGPSPDFIRYHSVFGMILFFTYLTRPSYVMTLLLKDSLLMTPHLQLFTQLYGTLGLSISIQLFLEPVLSRSGSLLHGLLACVLCSIILKHRELVNDTSIVVCAYFIFVGIYFIIRAPNAIKVPASADDIKRVQAGSPKFL